MLSLKERLEKLADYGKISATAFMIRRVYNNKLNIQQQPRSPHQEKLVHQSRQSKKIYIPVYLNKFRIVGCLDSGSDVTIMQESLFNQIFKKSTGINQSEVSHIVTFSDDTVNVLGEKPVYVKLESNHPGILMSIECKRSTITFFFSNSPCLLEILTLKAY